MGKLPRKYLIRRVVLGLIVLALLAFVIWIALKIGSGIAGCVSGQGGSSAVSGSSDTSASESESASEPSVEEQWLAAESATSPSAWNLILVNDENRKDETYTPPLTAFEDTEYRVHPGICAPLTALIDAADNDGVILVIDSSYRGYDVQKQVYDNKVQELENEGYNQWDAPVRAGWEVPYPGESEHLTGLAVDLKPRYEEFTFDDSFAETKTGKWLAEHCYEYGFIIRYPKGHEEHTGFAYEPWHLRYVGKDAAAAIQQKGICFEEYLGKPLSAQ